MFGPVTHTLDATAMRVRSMFALFTFCKHTVSCSLIPKENKYSCNVPLYLKVIQLNLPCTLLVIV